MFRRSLFAPPPIERNGRLLIGSKVFRAFAFGLNSVGLGLYLAELGLTGPEVGLILAAAIAGTTLLTLVIAVAACLISTATFAGPTRDTPTSTQPSTAPRTAPVLTCAISPAAVPGPGEFQVTDVTVTLRSGSLAANKKVDVRLGSSRGNVITSFCSSDFGRDRTATDNTVTIGPPITDPNYHWQCVAVATTAACDPEQVPH